MTHLPKPPCSVIDSQLTLWFTSAFWKMNYVWGCVSSIDFPRIYNNVLGHCCLVKNAIRGLEIWVIGSACVRHVCVCLSVCLYVCMCEIWRNHIQLTLLWSQTTFKNRTREILSVCVKKKISGKIICDWLPFHEIWLFKKIEWDSTTLDVANPGLSSSTPMWIPELKTRSIPWAPQFSGALPLPKKKKICE